jgi:predicted peroxiredoxin
MPPNGRVIVGCTHGEEDPDRVAVSYLTAGAALDHGKQVVMWLTSEGVRLALRGYVDPIRAQLDPPVKRLHDQFIERAAASSCARSASASATSTRASSSRTPSSRARPRSWSSRAKGR